MNPYSYKNNEFIKSRAAAITDNVYPIISTSQVQNLHGYILSVIREILPLDHTNSITTDEITVNKLKSNNNKPITAEVTNAISSYKTTKDINELPLTGYIHNIEPVMYHNDQIRIKTGKDNANKDLGNIITINNVENAQNDNNGLPLNSYINNVAQYEDNTLTFTTGEQKFNNIKGQTFTINHVDTADKAERDIYGNEIINTYAKINHNHNIDQIDDLNTYIENIIITTINTLIREGKLSLITNSVQLSQYPKYDFEKDETVYIRLKKNTLYNRLAPEILKFKEFDRTKSIFKYQFDSNTYKYNSKFIDNSGKLIIEKKISFGSPRKLADGFISKSGIITLDDLQSINTINIEE